MTWRRLIIGFLFFLTLSAGVFAAAEHPYRVFIEETVATVAQSWVPGTFTISPDGRFAYVVVVGNQQKVVLDGEEQQAYQEIAGLRFSPDGKHFAYVAKQGHQSYLVYDGNTGKPFDAIDVATLRFSPDGRRYAFIGKTGDKHLVVTEAGAGKTYDEINGGSLRFSPDSMSLAYIARLGNKWFLVTDGRESEPYDEIPALEFSADGKRVAAIVRFGDQYAVTVNGEIGPAFTRIKSDSLVFCPDGQRIGYIAIDGGREFCVIDHQAGNDYDRIISKKISFAPDGARTAFAVERQGSRFMVVDGEEGKPYPKISAHPPLFSPDGRKLAYAAFNGRDWLVVVNGVEQAGYAGIGEGSLLFNNRGSRLAYIAKLKTGAWTVVSDGIAGPYYDAIAQNSLAFSPDGKNLVYSARRGNKWFVVLDNREGRLYDGIVAGEGPRIRFDGSAFFRYVALDGRRIVAIKERISNKSDFLDFERSLDSQMETGSLTTQQFQFEFKPPHGLVYLETFKITDLIESEIMNQRLHEEEITTRNEISQSPSGYQINHTIINYRVYDIEDQAGGEALSVLEGVKYASLFDSQGFFTGFKGLEEFERKLKTLPAKHYRKYRDYFSKEAIESRFRYSWKTSVEDYLGKTIQIGDVWEKEVDLPLPNGEIVKALANLELAGETVINSRPHVIIKVDYDFDSSALKEFIREMLLKEAPRLTSQPEIEFSGEGESIVDPQIMLVYSAQQELAMRVLMDLPELGEKEFIYKRIMTVTADYLDR